MRAKMKVILLIWAKSWTEYAISKLHTKELELEHQIQVAKDNI